MINRKNEKQFIGNNMEKPHIFLNRIKVRGTTQKDEELEAESGYKKKEKPMSSIINVDDDLDFGYAP